MSSSLNPKLVFFQVNERRDYIRQALRDGLDVAESGLTSTNRQQSNGLVDTAERRNIDGLSSHSTGAADTGGVLTVGR